MCFAPRRGRFRIRSHAIDARDRVQWVSRRGPRPRPYVLGHGRRRGAVVPRREQDLCWTTEFPIVKRNTESRVAMKFNR